MRNQLNKLMDEDNHHWRDCETKIAAVENTVHGLASRDRQASPRRTAAQSPVARAVLPQPHPLHGYPGGEKSLADVLNLSFAASPMLVKGTPVKAAVETSPTRRRYLSTWYTNMGPNITKRERARDIHDTTGMVCIGCNNRQTGGWTWCETAASTSGVKIPQRLDGGHIKDENAALEAPPGGEYAEQHEVKMDIGDAENTAPNRPRGADAGWRQRGEESEGLRSAFHELMGVAQDCRSACPSRRTTRSRTCW